MSKDKTKKLSAEMKLGIANIILTVITGIILTIFFNFRNENFQKELIYLQENVSQAASLANLEIYTTCWNFSSCDGAIRIVNNGLATAQNIQMVIVIDEVNKEWSQHIKDINIFSIDVLPPSLISTTESTKKSVRFYSDTLIGNNAYEINVGALPPDSYIDIILQMQYDGEMNTYNEKRTAIVYADSISMDIGDELDYFISEEYKIVSFTASALCDNCKQIAETKFFVSMLDSRNQRVISQKDGHSEVEFDLSFSLPKDSTHTSDSSIFYIDVLQEEGKRVQLNWLQEQKK